MPDQEPIYMPQPNPPGTNPGTGGGN